MSTNQYVAIIASADDGIFYNFKSDKYVDLDEEFKMSNIAQMIYDQEERKFYLLANKYNEKLGFYLIQFDENDPTKH